MPASVIGKSLNNGFLGAYAEQGDHLVKTYANTGDAELDFGAPVFATADGVAVAGSTGLTPTDALFVGVAIQHVQSATVYPNQEIGVYAQNDPTPVIIRGSVTVLCNNAATNAPAVNGPVYIRIAAGTAAKPVGGFEAAADDVNTIQLTNCCWGSTADSNGVALLIIKSRNNA